ncbi:hypothetical protein [Reyranella sp.]|uniref:hypothetical protein n=1 Tax=Reyranella sp. TaxID=1929291 RepID=UPI003D0C558E
MVATLKPILTISGMQAQSIVDRVVPGHKLSRIGELLVGEISAVFEIELDGGPPAYVLKVYPEALHWKMQKGNHGRAPARRQARRGDAAYPVG